MSQIVETTGLVLRKTPYSETSLVFVLLSPDRGRLHFLAKGAMRQGKRNFPAIDLFRLVQVFYRPGRSELHTARQVELVRDFSRIAAIPAHFRSAVWLARFSEWNCVPEDPAPRLYEALRSAFARLAGPRLDSCLPVCLGVVLTALAEQGLLPDLGAYPAKAAAMDEMLAYASDPRLETPAYTGDIWLRLAAWAREHSERSGLRLPDGWEEIQ